MGKHLSAENEVVIGRPRSEVFAFFADAENDPRWRSEVKSIHRVGDPGLGAVYEQRVTGPGGRGVNADITVTEFDPPARLGFVGISGPVRPQGSYEFTEVEGGTRVSFRLSVDLGGAMALVMAGTVQKTMTAEVAALSKAKAHLEAEQAG